MFRFVYSIFTLIIFPLILPGKAVGLPDPQRKLTISGYITDSETGERLAGVTVIEINLKVGTSTNEYGYYTLAVYGGKWDLQLSYIGYKTVIHNGQASKNIIHDFVMERLDTQLGEVVIEAKRSDENVRAPSMGMVKLDVFV